MSEIAQNTKGSITKADVVADKLKREIDRLTAFEGPHAYNKLAVLVDELLEMAKGK